MEYAALRYAHPVVETVTKTQYWERRLEKERKKENLCDRDPDEDCFDIILSISSFEHDGLGRYGDPLGLSELKAAANIESIYIRELIYRPESIVARKNIYIYKGADI